MLVPGLGEGAGKKAGAGTKTEVMLDLYVPTKVKRSMGERTQQIRLRLSPTFPRIFAKGEEGKLTREMMTPWQTDPCECFGHNGPVRYFCVKVQELLSASPHHLLSWS